MKNIFEEFDMMTDQLEESFKQLEATRNSTLQSIKTRHNNFEKELEESLERINKNTEAMARHNMEEIHKMFEAI